MSRRVMDLADVYADRLGVESRDAVPAELAARFEHLSRFVLGGEVPSLGRLMSDEAAAAYGEVCVLLGFLVDARSILSGELVAR